MFSISSSNCTRRLVVEQVKSESTEEKESSVIVVEVVEVEWVVLKDSHASALVMRPRRDGILGGRCCFANKRGSSSSKTFLIIVGVDLVVFLMVVVVVVVDDMLARLGKSFILRLCVCEGDCFWKVVKIVRRVEWLGLLSPKKPRQPFVSFLLLCCCGAADLRWKT